MKIVLDTNILLVSISRKSQFRLIFDRLLSGYFTLLICNDLVFEYQEIIERKTNEKVAKNIIEMILSLENISKQDVYYKWNLIDEDKDDNKFVDCAIAGNADYIVTNDKHFNVVKNISFPSINVLNINEFMDMIKK